MEGKVTSEDPWMAVLRRTRESGAVVAEKFAPRRHPTWGFFGNPGHVGKSWIQKRFEGSSLREGDLYRQLTEGSWPSPTDKELREMPMGAMEANARASVRVDGR